MPDSRITRMKSKCTTKSNLKTSSILAATISIAILFGCENPEESQPAAKQIEIVGFAGIARSNTAAQGFKPNLPWITDSVNIYRVPRSPEELNHQVSLGYVRLDSASRGRNMYVSRLYLLNQWWHFDNNTVLFDQRNGPPEEVALATNISCSDNLILSYRVNWTGWVPMVCGRDYGMMGLDSMRIDSFKIASPIKSDWSLIGINLMKDKKNWILEGDNVLTIKVVKQNNDSALFSFRISYAIK